VYPRRPWLAAVVDASDLDATPLAKLTKKSQRFH